MSKLNANAFYEIGIRHMAQKPIIHVYLESETSAFEFACTEQACSLQFLECALRQGTSHSGSARHWPPGLSRYRYDAY